MGRFIWIWAAALIFFLIPAATAINWSVSGGNGKSITGAVMTYDSANKDFVSQSIKLHPQSGSLENDLSFSGPGSTERYTSGNSGGYAKTGLSVTGSNAQTTYDFAASGSTYAFQAIEELSSYGATSIFAYAYALSSGGDQTIVQTYVNDPYGYAQLSGYSGYGYGTSSSAYSNQQANFVYSPYGYTYGMQYAANRYGEVSYMYNYQNGGYVYYLPYSNLYPWSSSYPSAAYADSGWTVAQNSYDARDTPSGYTFAYSKSYYSSAKSGSQYQSSGWHIMFQMAYTCAGYYNDAWNYQAY